MAENFSVERRKLMRFLGARVVLTPAALKGTGMLAKAVELAAGARLVPVPAVRERSQRRRPFAHHRAGDPRRLRRRAARLLGHRLRHRRHAQGRGARAQGSSGRETAIIVVRAGQLAGARQRHRRRRACRDGTPARQPPELPAAPDAGLDAGLHSAPDGGRRRGRLVDEVIGRRTAPKRCAWRANWRARKASSSASPAARRSPARSRVAAARPRQPTSCACCPTPASATSARRCSKTSRPT